MNVPYDPTTAEAAARMYPTMRPTESEPAQATSTAQADSAAPADANQPVADALEAKAETLPEAPKEWIENIPENIAALRKADRLKYPAHYDAAMGFRTKAMIDAVKPPPPEQLFVRNTIANIAHDSNIAADDLSAIVNTVRAIAAGKSDAGGEAASSADLAEAHALVSRDPRIGALLNHFNAANAGHVVRILAAAARRERARGRL